MPAAACSKRPWLRLCAPVKAPRSWPNNSLSISSRGIAAMLMATNGPVRRRAVIVQRAGDQFLAGAALAIDHDGEVRGRQPRDGAVDFLHRLAAADQRQLLLAVARFGVGSAIAAGTASARPTTASSSFRSNGFGRYSKAPRCAAFTAVISVDCALMTMTRNSGPDAADARQQIEPVIVGHDHVGDDEIALAFLHPTPQHGGRTGRAHLVTGAA